MTITDIVNKHFSAASVSDGKELRFACPLCDDHKDRMYINARSGRWLCFNCEEAGGLITFLERVCGYDPFEAYRLAERIGRYTRPAVADGTGGETVDRIGLYPIGLLLELDRQEDALQKPFWDYAIARGILPSEALQLGLRYSLVGSMRGRLIFPVVMDNQLQTWAGRTIGNQEPKWLYSRGPHVSQLLYGLDDVWSREEVILVEGIFDAHRLRGKAVATFGAHLSPAQRLLLHREGFKRVTLLYDGDDAGRHGARRHGKELWGSGFDVRIAYLPEGTDPATAHYADLIKALADATSLSQ